MRTLFEISWDLMALAELLDEVGGEITEDKAGAALEDWFNQLGAERDKKLDGYCVLIQQYEAIAEAREAEAKRLMALAASDANNAKRLRARLKTFFEIQGMKKLETPRFKIAVQANGGKAPLIFPDRWREEPASAPEAFHKPTILLNVETLRKTVEEFYAKAEEIAAGTLDDQERRRLFRDWIERDDEARKTKELIEGCSIAPRGSHLRIR